MIFLKNIAEYKRYFEVAASEHNKISSYHYGDVDSAIRWTNSNEDGTEGYVMWLEPYSAKPKLREDSKLLGKKGALIIMHPWEPANDENDSNPNFPSKTTCEQICEEIVIDVISRIKNDSKLNFLHTDFSDFNWDFIDPNFTGYYVGVRLELDYNHGQNFCINADNWVAVETPTFTALDYSNPKFTFTVEDEKSVLSYALIPIGLTTKTIITASNSGNYDFNVIAEPGRTYFIEATLSDGTIKSSQDDGITYTHPV